MAEQWRDAVYRIDSAAAGSHAFGTGFVCHREGDKTYLLTCNHVLIAIGEDQARIRQLPIQVVARGDDTLDLALIVVTGLADSPVLSLSEAGKSGRPFVVYGYTWADPNDKKSGKSLARPLEGRLGAQTAFASDVWPKVPAWDLPFDRNNQFAELLDGYSGSPVWDPQNQRVIAVVSHRRGKKMGYAIAVSNLLKFYPQAEAFFQTTSAMRKTERDVIEVKATHTTPRHFDTIRHEEREQSGQMSDTHQSIPRVFISYSHDSPEHANWVLSLSERLRKDGVETILDQYINGTPSNGWARWMLDQIDEADFVLLICTETYYRRFRGHEEPDKGKGADWEGAVITQEIYDRRSDTPKFVPVLSDPHSQRCIPEPVRGHTFYPLISKQAYQKLYDFLLGQAGIEAGMLGKPSKKARKQGEPLSFPDENTDFQSPDHAYQAQPESATELNRTAHRNSPISQQPVDPKLLVRLRDLLIALPRWDDRRRRRAFVNGVLWGHPVLKEIDLEGPGVDVAADLATACLERDEPTSTGQSPLCAMLTAMVREFGPKSARDREIAALGDALDCHAQASGSGREKHPFPV